METLTRLVSESLARHGFDRPLDYGRLQWSEWYRPESHHSLLVVPSKPGVFVLAEEVIDLESSMARVEIAPSPALSRGEGAVPRSLGAAKGSGSKPEAGSPNPEARRLLVVGQFSVDDDMAFVLDRMLSYENPMRARLASGRYFVRFVVIEDPCERRRVSNALHQGILSSAEKSTGPGSQFATLLELSPEPPNLNPTPALQSADSSRMQKSGYDRGKSTAPLLHSAITTTIHCSSSFPSGF